MGNQQSAPAITQAIAQVQARQPPVTPDPVAECQANKIKVNQLQGQLSQANSSVERCDPSVSVARNKQQIQQQNEQYVNQQGAEQSRLNAILIEKFKLGTDLTESVKLLKQYEKQLKEELNTVEKDTMTMEHDERKYRRDFLDNQPTDGVPWHVFGLQTSDDKVMLTFWITALISFSFLAHIVLATVAPNEDFKGRAMKGAISVIVALIASYLLITYLG